MNTKEYNIKIKELRKERNFHQDEVRRLDEEMDKLVNSIDKEKVDWMLEKFIKIDRRVKGGYLEFFYVDKIENRPRGYTLYGRGFKISDKFINIDDTCTLFVEDGHVEMIEEITKEDYYLAFDTYIKLIREELDNVKSYKTLGNQFAFKKSLIEATLELRDENTLDNKVLAILKTD